MNPVFRDIRHLVVGLSVVTAGAAHAQFEHVVQAHESAQVKALATQVCDTSAFPPFNRYGPWSFVLCDGASTVVATCRITASPRAVQNLPSTMMRRTLLRLIENHMLTGDVALANGQGPLTVTCQVPEDQAS